ncbi:hypothetical protein ACZ87_03394, partial [Candidatus Erwinia dacicola]
NSGIKFTIARSLQQCHSRWVAGVSCGQKKQLTRQLLLAGFQKLRLTGRSGRIIRC